MLCASTGKGPNVSNWRVISFILILSLASAFLLAVVAYGLHEPQQEAKTFDRNKQMLIAAGILNHRDEFIFDEHRRKATNEEIEEIARLRIRPLVTNAQGEVFTLEEQGLTLDTYLAENKKRGYAHLPLKLFYAILPNNSAAWDATQLKQAAALVIPISGFGLWAPIYGYLALALDGDTVIGTTWYEMAETPGLGANITAPWWQSQFEGKLIFHEQADGKTDPETAGIGVIVVKGRVQDIYGTHPLSHSAVDGLSGATLTGNGVTAAYKDSLTPYRSLLIHLYKEQS